MKEPLNNNQFDFLISIMSLDLEINSEKDHGYKLQDVIHQLSIINEYKHLLEDMEHTPRKYEQTTILDYCIVRPTDAGLVSNTDILGILDLSKFYTDRIYDLNIR